MRKHRSVLTREVLMKRHNLHKNKPNLALKFVYMVIQKEILTSSAMITHTGDHPQFYTTMPLYFAFPVGFQEASDARIMYCDSENSIEILQPSDVLTLG